MFEKEYDLVVCGAGVAGIAAAVAAGRRGVKTALVEKTVLTGGLATTGLIIVYLPVCDGNGRQVSFGITAEMLERSVDYGPGRINRKWSEERNAPEPRRYRMVYSPGAMILTLDKMLEEAGVEVWFDTVVTGAEVEGDRISAIQVYNKSGAGKIKGNIFVDATGDSDLAVACGEKVHCGKNALACWVLEYRKNVTSVTQFTEDIWARAETEPLTNETLEAGINGKLVSESILNGRRRYREHLVSRYQKEEGYSKENLYPLSFPAMPNLRHTRCFAGKFALETGMLWTRFEDSIGLGADWRAPGKVWEIPYRTLLPQKISNLLAAGRCTAARDDAWEITRVIPVAALTGEVAGVSAALSLQQNVSPSVLPYASLAEELRKKCGFSLHFEEAGLTIPPKN